jgi:predicted double-glycine peptidase
LALPDVHQSTGYTCSAAALLAVLAYFGQESREDLLTAELGATPERGAPPDAIARVARAHGLGAELREPMTSADVASLVARGLPVLLPLQAWPATPRATFTDDWQDGHYVVVVAVEGDTVVVEDPSLLGSRGVLTRRDLEARWHDSDGVRRYVRAGIVFSGPPPNPPPARRPLR